MSTQPENKNAVRSKESLLAEIILCKKLGWEIGFISGGIGAFTQPKFEDLLKSMHAVANEKFWLNIGPLSKTELKKYLPYTKGVVGSIETVNEKLHKQVCPSKPTKPYLEMFKHALQLGLKTGITIILGLGETIDDYPKLSLLIKKYKISKIHLYGLNPQKGTAYEHTKPPTAEYQAEWIRKTKQEFPETDMQCGIWADRTDRVSTLLDAGADSISKFPILKLFGTEYAKEIERQAKLAGREFKGTLTQLPKTNWDEEVDLLDIQDELKEKIKEKLKQYIRVMENNIKKTKQDNLK